MRYLLTVLMSLASAPVFAHPGHLADLAGHNHWIALGALGIAVLAGIYAGRKKRKGEPEEEIEEETEEQPA